MIKLKKIYFFHLILCFYLCFTLMNNFSVIMAMENQKSCISTQSIDTKAELFRLLTVKKQLSKIIHNLRNKNQLNDYEKKEMVQLENKYIELNQKILTIDKNISQRTKKVTFNLKPFIKFI